MYWVHAGVQGAVQIGSLPRESASKLAHSQRSLTFPHLHGYILPWPNFGPKLSGFKPEA